MRSNHDVPPLVIRADADTKIGTGHVMRCLALAQAWQARGGKITFLSCFPDLTLRRRIKAAGFDFKEADGPHPDATDLQSILAALDRVSSDAAQPAWVVLDGYHFDVSYQSALRAAGYRVMVIDDTAHLPYYDADIILNHGANAPWLAYSGAPNTLLLLGTRYALVRAEFERWIGLEKHCPKVPHNILVTLGGSDPANATIKVVEALRRIDLQGSEARVVVGPMSAHFEELQAVIGAPSGKVRLETDVTDISPLLAWADLAVAAGGTTCWELAFMKVPALILILAENQVGVGAVVEEFGVAQTLGRAEDLTAAKIATALRVLMNDWRSREEMARRGRILVDGHGVKRVLDVMMQPKGGQNLRLRPAGQEDGLLIWEWANDPKTRKNSFSSNPISWSNHESWYEKRLASTDSCIWILEYRQVAVGQIRYDRINSDTAQISFSVAPNYRGRNLGAELLQHSAPLACEKLGVRWLEGVTFVDNVASNHAFLKAGFDLVEEKTIADHPCRVFRRSYSTLTKVEDHVALP